MLRVTVPAPSRWQTKHGVGDRAAHLLHADLRQLAQALIFSRLQLLLDRAERDEDEGELELELLRHHVPPDPVTALAPACLRRSEPTPGRVVDLQASKSRQHARTLVHVVAVLPGGH